MYQLCCDGVIIGNIYINMKYGLNHGSAEFCISPCMSWNFATFKMGSIFYIASIIDFAFRITINLYFNDDTNSDIILFTFNWC